VDERHQAVRLFGGLTHRDDDRRLATCAGGGLVGVCYQTRHGDRSRGVVTPRQALLYRVARDIKRHRDMALSLRRWRCVR